MKSRLFAVALLAILALPVYAAETGRYQVVTGSTHTVLLDTRTGRTWVLAPAEYKAGMPQAQRYEWNPIGFRHGRTPTPPSGNHSALPRSGAARHKN